jgi:hypothetical protein
MEDRWFPSIKFFDHLWAYKTTAVGTVMPNRKEFLNKHFQKNGGQRTELFVKGISSAIKWNDAQDVHSFT